MKVFELIEKLQQCDANATVDMCFNAECYDIEYVESIKCEEADISAVHLVVW